ncbi:hypothetical protein [Actinomadura kijaniata]|uniref:hypothetical protein n=1 Tax=Actinomadura kijaniata TaxID=46161 RepID=UPI0008331B2B|nr:hypothetical protein [Actinomadura kijaniata]
MTRILTRFLDGRVCAYLSEGEGLLEPVAVFPVTPGAEPCGHDAAPDLEHAVYATRHEVVCVGRDGTERWRYDLLPRSTQRYGHSPDCAFSRDGAVVWLYRPDAYAGRGGPDRWVVLDAATGAEIDRVELDCAGHGGVQLRHPDGVHVLLDVGEGQDGVRVYRGSLVDGRLETSAYPWDHRSLIDLSPDGRRFMTVDHGRGDAAFHDDPDGKETLELAVEVFGHDPDEASVEWSGGFLDADTAIVTISEDEEERHHHYLVDLRTGGVVERLETHARTPYDLELPGDGSWVTSDGEGRPVRRTRR